LKTFIFDIECFKNLFCLTAINAEDEKEEHVFYVGLEKNDYSDIKEFLNQEMILVGFNNFSYDDPMLRFLISYSGDKFPTDAYELSSKLIDENYREDKKIMNLRYPRNEIYPWKSVDLMKILGFDKTGVSLKQTGINLKWYKIQDLPIDPSVSVKSNQLDMVLSYNKNDTLITKELYEEIAPIRKLREELGKIYPIDFSSASDSKIANLIFEHVYSTEMHVDIRALRAMRTPREKVLLGECVAKFVNFQSPELKEMLKRISSTWVYAYNDYRYRESIYFANCGFSLGVGGLHTEDAPGIFGTDEQYIIQDCDVASYYPNLIINNNFYPEHLGPNFIQVLKKITTERLGAKKNKDKVKADGLKITANASFGKLGSQFFWLYDPKQFLSTTISGQMGLLMLVEGMYMNGIEVISCNTDGVVCRIDRKLESKYYEIAHAWEKATNLELEFTEYKKYVRRDVNSYITEKADGDTKEKGVFLKEVDLKKSYHMPIVAKALHAYFINSVPVRETLENCKDIMEFCISQKSGKNYGIELHAGKKIEYLQKTNRFFITTKGGTLLKREQFTKRVIGLYVGRLVHILNEYDTNVPFEDYHVDLSFYEKETMKTINEIEPLQMALFGLSFQDAGKIVKADSGSNVVGIPEEKDATASQMNKLGKNQLIKKIESIVENNSKIDGISPRYVYIDAFEARSMNAIIYCLAKGVRQSISIDKQAYKKNKLEIGQIIYCNKFEKRETGHAIVDYRITENLKEIGEKLI
jgi:hypothetical protein